MCRRIGGRLMFTSLLFFAFSFVIIIELRGGFKKWNFPFNDL